MVFVRAEQNQPPVIFRSHAINTLCMCVCIVSNSIGCFALFSQIRATCEWRTLIDFNILILAINPDNLSRFVYL